MSTEDYLAQFFECLTAERGYSEHTLSAYRSDLDQFRIATAYGELIGCAASSFPESPSGCIVQPLKLTDHRLERP
ncbi:MAG: site-specific integrase [Steroidobacteraceae bacterium]